jgi:hypothetical protein
MLITELKTNVIVRGPVLPEPVQVIRVVPIGTSIKLVGRGLTTGLVHHPILNTAQLATLEATLESQPFDGDPRNFKLGVEALRLGIAYEYDPYFSLSIARVEVPAQKWMNFYTKVLAKFATSKGLRLTVKVEAAPESGVSKQVVEETKAALRELNLNEHVKTAN